MLTDIATGLSSSAETALADTGQDWSRLTTTLTAGIGLVGAAMLTDTRTGL